MGETRKGKVNKRAVKWFIWLVLLVLMVLGVSLFSLHIGSAGIPIRKVASLILNGKGTVEHSILFDIRLPRIILGFAIGGALSLAGVLLQGMFRNVLVEPYTLGISGGAGLGVCLGIMLRIHKTLGVLSLPILGFIGATVVILLVYNLSTKKGILKIQGLLLTGVMISFISSSLIMLIMAISRTEDLRGIIFWIMGSLEETSWFFVNTAVVISVIALICSYFYSLRLNALSLGEEGARHLGVDTEKTKRVLFIIASLLTGLSVSIAGIIGFVGLVVPHFVRMVIGRDHRVLLAGSFLCGAGFLIFCDTVARTIISPLELPVGVITGILGGSLFIWVLAKKRARI